MQLFFSSCPNDTFIFHALLHNKIDTEGLKFEVQIADIDQLNHLAIQGNAEVIKLSFAVYPAVSQRYWLLDSGSALGHGNGPLLVARHAQVSLDENATVAIAGEQTTAALLMKLAFPQVVHYVPMLFSQIPAAVKNGEVTAGVLIHESRFTYAQQGLQLVADLGAWWEQQVHLPIPLGGIAMLRNLPLEQQQSFARVLHRSVNYALQNPNQSAAFVQHHAQELSRQVIEQHIHMFVNNYTQTLGTQGQQAIRTLLSKNAEKLAEKIFFETK